jgi:hypothetical protein
MSTALNIDQWVGGHGRIRVSTGPRRLPFLERESSGSSDLLDCETAGRDGI